MSLPHDGCSRTVPLAFATVNTISCSYPLVSDRVDAAPGELLDEWRAATGSSGSKILEGEVYGPKGAHNARAIEGLPVGIQVVCQPWEEERVLAIMHVVDAALGPRGFGTRTPSAFRLRILLRPNRGVLGSITSRYETGAGEMLLSATICSPNTQKRGPCARGSIDDTCHDDALTSGAHICHTYQSGLKSKDHTIPRRNSCIATNI